MGASRSQKTRLVGLLGLWLSKGDADTLRPGNAGVGVHSEKDPLWGPRSAWDLCTPQAPALQGSPLPTLCPTPEPLHLQALLLAHPSLCAARWLCVSFGVLLNVTLHSISPPRPVTPPTQCLPKGPVCGCVSPIRLRPGGDSASVHMASWRSVGWGQDCCPQPAGRSRQQPGPQQAGGQSQPLSSHHKSQPQLPLSPGAQLAEEAAQALRPCVDLARTGRRVPGYSPQGGGSLLPRPVLSSRNTPHPELPAGGPKERFQVPGWGGEQAGGTGGINLNPDLGSDSSVGANRLCNPEQVT